MYNQRSGLLNIINLLKNSSFSEVEYRFLAFESPEPNQLKFPQVNFNTKFRAPSITKMSNRFIQQLWEEALTSGAHEAKTAKYWHHLLKSRVFTADRYIVSAEQPITVIRGDTTRVDIIVEDYSQRYKHRVLFFHEMKRPSSGPGVVLQVETQVYEACKAYLEIYGRKGVWAVTTLGTRYRIWFCKPQDSWLRAFAPKTTGPSVADEYIESYKMGHSTCVHSRKSATILTLLLST